MVQANPSTEFELGRAALELGRDAIALEHFVLAAEDPTAEEQRVAALAFAAEINLGLGRPYEAITWTDRLRAESPRPDQADLLEAVARLRLGDGRAALALVERVREPDTAHHSYRPSSRHLVRGEALRLVSRPQEALEELAAAIRADPGDPDVWRALGELCQQPEVDPGVVVTALTTVNLMPPGASRSRETGGIVQEDRMLTAAERAEFERREWHEWMWEIDDYLKAVIIVVAEAVADEPGDRERVAALSGLILSRDLVGCIGMILAPEEGPA